MGYGFLTDPYTATLNPKGGNLNGKFLQLYRAFLEVGKPYHTALFGDYGRWYDSRVTAKSW